MKAKLYDEIRRLVDVHSDFGDRLIPKGTMGAIVECYEHPVEGYAVDLAIPDKRCPVSTMKMSSFIPTNSR